ncbi:MAG: glycogen debranching enzyme N-terminal domain-containing protein, partial [Verrucomicrobia bacterium]|nr:glycogen debranching enzyme N-terminal domain-containing protein [Verrucomicrobiota bacterium]
MAARGRAWSLLRNRLCALASVSGGYGFACGVEWLAPERINVHSSRGLRWGHGDNVVTELAQLNRLLAQHPCFFDGAKLTRLSATDSAILALRREASVGGASVLVLVNTDAEREQHIVLNRAELPGPGLLEAKHDLLGQGLPKWDLMPEEKVRLKLPAGGAFCLEIKAERETEAASSYVRARARAAWAVQALREAVPPEQIGSFDWRWLADWVDEDPARFLGLVAAMECPVARNDLRATLKQAANTQPFPRVVTWTMEDCTRIMVVPQDHWLLVQDQGAFRATLALEDGPSCHVQSIAVRAGHVACFPPGTKTGQAALRLERYGAGLPRVEAKVRYLPAAASASRQTPSLQPKGQSAAAATVLLTNRRGGMARLCVDLGRINSKYDCLLGANLHPAVPVDRHIFAKRVRVWINADGFITPLNADNLVAFVPGPPAVWRFVANAGDGRAVEIVLTASMVEGKNTTVLHFHRTATPPPLGRELLKECAVSLTAR